jgi:hypothetical protein
MIRKTTVTLTALVIAALVAPGLAEAKTGNHRAAHRVIIDQVRVQRVIEGRDAAGFAAFGGFGTFNGAPSGRDAMVQSLGN